MKELQGQNERLQSKNDQLRVQIKESRDLGKDVQDNGRTAHPIARNKRKEPIASIDVNTPKDDELSSSSSPSLSLLQAKNVREGTKTKSHKRPSPHPTLNDVVSGTSCRARKEAGRRQHQPDQALGDPSVLPVHPVFGTAPTLYMPPAALIQRPDDMLSFPLRQHILDYEPPHGVCNSDFTMFDGSADPYHHMLHYNQAMTLNSSNNWLLYKVFSASLRGPALAWFHKLPRYSINSFNELWVIFI